MDAASSPTPIPAIWAYAADPSYINTIPTPSQQGIKAGAASFADGWPPLCFVPFASGGAGPFGSDFNGILAQVTAGLQWSQAGGFLPYSGAYSAIIGGYASGAIVQSATTPGSFWRSTVDDNVTNPDASGAGWTPFPPIASDSQIGLARADGVTTTADGGAISVIAYTASADVVYLTAGTYSQSNPAWASVADIEVWGGGGGGSGSSQGAPSTVGSSGGAGGSSSSRRAAITPGGTLTVVVGAGGSGASSGGLAGSGGTSSVSGGGLSGTIQATGGNGGSGGPGQGGIGTGGVDNRRGQSGQDLDGTSLSFAVGGCASSGGGLGGSVNAAGTPQAPTAPGGGGGANYFVLMGQGGASGGARITYYAE